MSEPTESVEEPTQRFTEIRQIMLVDRVLTYMSCRECGAGIFIDPEDRKNDIHPGAIHLRWHEDLNEQLNEMTRFMEDLPKPGTDAPEPEFWDANKDELTKEATDADRQIPSPANVQKRGAVGTDRPEAARPKPVPGVPREGRGQGQGNAGRPRPPQG